MAQDYHSELKSLLEEKRLIIGSKRTFKGLKTGNIAKVFLATNATKEMKADSGFYGNLSGVEIIQLELSNEEIGVTCRKQYPISVLGVRKE